MMILQTIQNHYYQDIKKGFLVHLLGDIILVLINIQMRIKEIRLLKLINF